jgi:hypothetical protein
MTLTDAPAAVAAMAARLTLPFARGADLIDLVPQAGPTGDQLLVPAYDFADHQARFGLAPDPSYLLRALDRVPDGMVVTAEFADPAFPGGSASSTVEVPAGTDRGDSLAIPLPPLAGGGTRLVGLRETNLGAPTTDASGRWSVSVLLGTMARLLWVIGVERDRLTRVRDVVSRQRNVAAASGASLDFIGADLGVPRFPPTPYAFDPDTIALYHLDDVPGPAPTITDVTGAFPGRAGHDGVMGGATEAGQPGRYGQAVRFGVGGAVTIASSPEFDISAAGSFTAECFVRPDPATTLGTVLSRTGGAFGWSIEVGDVGLGVPRAVRATISDGARTLTVSSAVSLASNRFTHVAAVLRRDPLRPLSDSWSLVVDGVPVASQPVGALGAVAGSADIVIGPFVTGFVGTVDEVRFSSTARAGFHPVLGEADDQYRERLGLFRRWVLPTSANLTAVLNRLVPEIDGVADPFVVSDADGPTQSGSHLVRVWPYEIAPRQSIDAAGRLDLPESALWPAAQPAADPALLGRQVNPLISYSPAAHDPARDPALASPDPQLMQPSVANALDRLVILLSTLAIPGTLTIVSGFDQAAPDGRAAGRAVLLALPGVAYGRLAALAHRAGFDYVQFRLPSTVYAACRPGQELLLGPVGSGQQQAAGQLPEVTVGDSVTITVGNSTASWTAPTLPPDATVRYWAIPAATGRGVLTMASPADLTATLTATAPGPLAISADVTRNGHVLTGSGCIVVRPGPFADGAAVAADGTTGVAIGAVGPAEAGFDPVYLANLVDPRIDFGGDPAHHFMQRGLARSLTRLADQLAADGLAGVLTVASAYAAAAPPGDLTGQGRVLLLTHSGLAAADLAVRAHRAGFDFVQRLGATVLVAAKAGDLVGVDGPDEVEAGSTITLAVAPGPSAVSPTTRLGWSSGQVVAATPEEQGIALMSAASPTVTATGSAPGVAWVRATLRDASTAGPYAFTVTLRPALAGARIALDDYYLLMNALNTLHPVGVEVLTESIRAAVVELGNAPSGLDPMFTFPPFRLHRAAAGIRKGVSR